MTNPGPGFTRTSFAAAAEAEDAVDGIPALSWMEADPVRRAGLQGVASNRATVVPGFANRAVSRFVNSVPGLMKRKLGQVVNDFS